jgi:hypothetical protein
MQLFAYYSCPWVRKSLGLDFRQFVDTINVFSTGTGAELALRFPGPNEELICECVSCPYLATLLSRADIAS